MAIPGAPWTQLLGSTISACVKEPWPVLPPVTFLTLARFAVILTSGNWVQPSLIVQAWCLRLGFQILHTLQFHAGLHEGALVIWSVRAFSSPFMLPLQLSRKYSTFIRFDVEVPDVLNSLLNTQSGSFNSNVTLEVRHVGQLALHHNVALQCLFCD